jgi:hypothetical protein
MNEQVISDLYNRAVSNGYKKSREEFVSLIQTNDAVLNDMYSYVQSKGYGKGVEDFSVLVGKKKDDTGLSTVDGTSALPSGEKDTLIERTFGKNAVTDFFGDIYRSYEAGSSKVENVDPTMNIFGKKASELDDASLEEFVKSYGKLANTPITDEMRQYQKDVEEAGGGFVNSLIQAVKNPGIIPQLVVDSFSMMVPFTDEGISEYGLAGAGAGALALGGTGAALGALGGPFAPVTATAGAVAGGLRGLMAGMSATTEVALSYGQFLKEEADKRGLEFNAENLKKLLEDENVVNEATNRSLARGATIGLVDAVTSGIAGRAMGATRAAVKGTAGKALGTAAGLGVESVGEGVGEGAAQVAAGQEVSGEEIALEMLGGFGGGVFNVAVENLIGGEKVGRYRINGEEVSKNRLNKFLSTATPDQVAKTNIEIIDDNDALKIAEDKKKEALLAGQIDPAVTDETEKTKLVKLEKERANLKGNDTKSAQNRVRAIDEEIDAITGKYTLQVEEEGISYKIDGSKMDRARFVAAVGEAKNEEALNELETTDPEVQKVIDAKRAELTGEIQPEVVDVETADPVVEEYVGELRKTKESDPETYWSVDEVTPEAAAEGTIIKEEGGYGVVGKDGDIKGVFKKATSKAKGVAQNILKKAVEAGGIKLDNFDTYLTDVYKKAGFRVVSRTKFNENFKPDGWNKEKHGTPDVVAMVYDPDNKLDIEEKTFDNPETGYDEMIGYRDSFVEKARSLYPTTLEKTPEVTITPETSSNYANMTEDNEGNFVFFHVGKKGYDTVKRGTGKAPVTSREEASALGKVGGMAMYYTGPEQGERQSAEGAKYAVKVPKEKVYDFNTDPLNLIEEAKKRHEEENPGKAFDPNSQIAYVTKIAGERGFDMVVADWAGGTRAQTTKELAPVDVEESTGNVIEKKFTGQYKSNKEKGFKSVVPARKADKLQKVYEKINEERNSQKRYDDLYRLYTETNKYTQDEITDLINNSDLSQEIKDEYNAALESKEEKRRSEKAAKVETAKQKKEALPENVEEAIKNSAKTLQTSFPGVKIIVADNINDAKKQIVDQLTPIGGKEAAESVAEQMKTARGQAVFYNGKPVAVIINKEKASSNTAAHEVWHLILREAFGRDAKKFKSFQNAIARELKKSGYTDVAEYLDRFAAAYEGDTAYEEYLAELGGLLTTKGFDPKNLTAQEKSILNKIKEIINKFAKSVIGKDVFLKDAKPENILQFMIDVSDLLAKGEDVRPVIGKTKAKKAKGIESSLQNDFSDSVSKLTFIYDKNSKKFEQLKKDGFINKDVDINDFNGKIIMLHRPDAAFSGEIQKNGETLVEGQGGMYYPIKFHDMNVFWASTESAVSSMVNSLRDVAFENGGKVYMALVSSPYDKLLSSTTMANAVMDFFSSKAVDKNFNITPAQLKSALISSSAFIKEVKKIKPDGSISIKNVGLKLKFSNKDSASSIKDKIAEKLSPTNSSFDDRKTFVEQLIKEMTANINQSDVSIQQFGELFSKGIQNKYFKGITKTGKVSISAANMTQALSEMFTEPVLKEGFDNRNTGGQVYAILEVDSPTITNPDDVNRIKELKKERSNYDGIKTDSAKRKVSAINAKIYAILGKNSGISPADSDFHKSYPKTVKSDNPVKIHILKDRPYWYDVFEGGIKKESRDSIFPTTSGVTTGGIQLNIPGVEISKQITTDKDAKPGYEAALEGINETVEERKLWRKQNKVNQKQRRNPIVEQAVKDYYNGLINQDQYIEIVKKNQPIKTFKSVPDLPSVREIVNSLDENKVATGIIGVTKNIKDGDRVASRLDIPAYEDFDTWVVSIHDGVKEGKSIAYGQTAVLKNVDFKTFPGPAIKIAMGTQSKSTIARIFGNWVNEDPDAVHERAKALMNDPKWTQVGMNPFRHSYFYDKTDGMPVATADEVIQVGALVLAKNAKKVLPSDPMFTTKSAEGFEIQFQKQLPARVNEQINNIISEQKALGNKPVDIAREAAKYLKTTDAYKKLGDRDKAKVLSGVKRLSGMRVKVLVDEYAALKDQLRAAEKLSDANKKLPNYKKTLSELVNSVRALVKAGKISTFRAGVIIGRISKTNLTSPESVNKTISYVADIFDNANLAMKVSRAKSLIKNAKRNIKSKIGQNPDLFNAGKVLVSIDPHFIPTPMIDDYLEIMEVIGERARVLSIQDAGDLTAKMNVIINAVMNESESVVNSAEQEKITMTPEESVEAAQSLIDQIKSDKLDTSNIVDPNDAAVARNISSITENDMNDLLSVDKDGITDFSKLKLLLGIRENIKAGIVTHEAMVLSTAVNQNRNKNQLQGVVNNLTGAKILNGVTRTISKIKGAITKRGGVLEAIRSTPLEFIDDVIGNFNDKTIHKLTFGILGSAKGKLDARLADLAAKAAAAEKLLQSAGRTDNAVVEAKYKIMVLQLQREFESNPGSPSVAPAIEFIDATLRAITRKESSLTNNDARILQEVRSQLTANGIAGIENSLTENDKKAMALIDEINAAQASEALFTSAVIRGNRVNIINNYVHHAVLSKNQRQETEAIINRLFDKGANGKPSTKAGTLNERTPGAKAIMFDPVSASMRGARETLTDFHMTPAIREVTGTLNKLKDSVFDDPNSTQEQRDVAQALVESVQESLEVTFQNHFGSDSAIEAFLKAIQKLGYQTTLASIPRAFAELSSNMSFAILSDPKTTNDALKYTKFAFSTNLLGFLEKIGSAESTRLAGNQTLTGKYAEGGFAAGYGRTSKSAASSKLMDYASFITRMTIGKAYRLADVTSDLLISTPDKVVSRAFYVADFINNFEKETGIRLTNNDLNKIADGTSEYLSPEFESAIQKARQTADSNIVRMAASGNSFNTILKNAPRKTDNAAMSAYRAINSFMSRFYLTEYGTLRSAVIALFKSGEIDKKAASAIIAASVTRMSMYLVAYSLLSSLFDSMIAQGLDLEEEEEDDEDLITKMKRSIVGTGVGVLSRRTLGNLGYMPIAFAVEQLNEDLGEDFGLRDDDYDPYKNSLVYSKISENDLLTKNPIEVMVKAVAGPLSPALSSAARAVTLYGRAAKEGSKKETKQRALEELETRMVLEAAGNLGLIPFYKDARRILLNDFYARNYDKKDDSSFTITQKQIDLVRKSNPTLARELQRIYNTQKAEEKKLEDFKKKFEKRQTKSN